MREHDPLNELLQEWKAPEPSAALDARVRAAWRTANRPSPWLRFWSARVTVPVPVLAALLVVVGALWIQFRSRPPAPHPATIAAPGDGYVTRIETAGFKPLPNGATRVIRAGEQRQ